MKPLAGTLVLDLTRMLPGAVLARNLVDLGARVLKIEDPGVGDHMRSAEPLLDGIGTGFRAFMRGTESVCLDLRSAEGQQALARLVGHADVLVESFRPGTLSRWGFSRERLEQLNPRLVSCSLSGFAGRDRAAHDVNLVAESGLMSQLGGRMPGVQVVDVTTGLLATSAILAALLQRAASGRGSHLEQPLAQSALPYLTWHYANAGERGLLDTVLDGESACYGLYRCADGLELAVGVLEPKFWAELVAILGLTEGAQAGMLTGEPGAEVRARVAARFASQPRAHWLALCEHKNLPVSPVNTLAQAMAGQPQPGPFIAGLEDPAGRPTPRLGEHTAAVAHEFGW